MTKRADCSHYRFSRRRPPSCRRRPQTPLPRLQSRAAPPAARSRPGPVKERERKEERGRGKKKKVSDSFSHTIGAVFFNASFPLLPQRFRQRKIRIRRLVHCTPSFIPAKSASWQMHRETEEKRRESRSSRDPVWPFLSCGVLRGWTPPWRRRAPALALLWIQTCRRTAAKESEREREVGRGEKR